MHAALAFLAALSAPAPAPVPPPFAQIGADCDRPQYATDRLVCGDAALLSLDQRMRYLLADRPEGMRSLWIEPQELWLRRRSMCAFQVQHAHCVTSAYRDRIATLEALHSTLPEDRTGAGCPGTAIEWMTRQGARRIFYDKWGVPVLIASDGGRNGPGWRDFAVFTETGPAVRVEFADDRTLSCRIGE